MTVELEARESGIGFPTETGRSEYMRWSRIRRAEPSLSLRRDVDQDIGCDVGNRGSVDKW